MKTGSIVMLLVINDKIIVLSYNYFSVRQKLCLKNVINAFLIFHSSGDKECKYLRK